MSPLHFARQQLRRTAYVSRFAWVFAFFRSFRSIQGLQPQEFP